VALGAFAQQLLGSSRAFCRCCVVPSRTRLRDSSTL
jgi:uncharacterized membrane protein YraQ (UPF0718 family)